MRFTCTTEIDLPINRVIEIFDDPFNLKHWQKGLVSYEHLKGTPREPGAKSKIIIHSGKHVIELIETILVRNFPQQSSALYEHKHMVNTMTNRFFPIGENYTKYETEVHYTRFIGFVPRMMALLMPGVFKKQVQETLDNFKNFAESKYASWNAATRLSVWKSY